MSKTEVTLVIIPLASSYNAHEISSFTYISRIIVADIAIPTMASLFCPHNGI